MPSDRDIALIRAGLEAAVLWLAQRKAKFYFDNYPGTPLLDADTAIDGIRALDPAVIASTVPEDAELAALRQRIENLMASRNWAINRLAEVLGIDKDLALEYYADQAAIRLMEKEITAAK